VAACLTQDAGDRRQLRPILARVQENLAAVGAPRCVKTLLADAGYWSDREIAPLLEDPTAPKLLPAPERHPAHRTRSSPSARLRARMRRRLASPLRRALYARRPQICEPVFGEIKWVRGPGGSCVGGAAYDAEWKLLCATNNLRKPWRAKVKGTAQAARGDGLVPPPSFPAHPNRPAPLPLPSDDGVTRVRATASQMGTFTWPRTPEAVRTRSGAQARLGIQAGRRRS